MAIVIRGSETPFHEAPEPEFRRFGKFLISGSNVPDAPFTFGRFVYPPGARSHAHTHQFGTEVYYCLSGELEAVVDGTVHRLKPGDLVIIPPGTHHFASNPGSTPAEFVAVHAPPVSDYDIFRGHWIERSAEISGTAGE